MAGIPFTFLPLENPSEILEIIKSNAEFCSGVIIFTSHIHKMIDRLIAEIKKPYCLISNRREFNCITPDYYDGARMVAEYFLDKHISHFVITYDSMTGVSVQKLRGFQETLLDNGVSPESIHPLKVENNNEESGRKAIMHFISTNKQEYPIGIFTLGDYLAKGICAGCIEKGIKIPDECMVVGGTGLSDTTDFNPPLSVLADPMFETGAKAAKMISKMIKTSSLKEPSLILPMKLVHRKTTIS
jgi:DNA-binding LacI/PurR family transcriptional regulator